MQVSIIPKNKKMQVMIIYSKPIVMQKKLVIILYIFFKTDDVQKLLNYLLNGTREKIVGGHLDK